MISNLEWLEADGLGGFASGTATGIRRRRYHALLLVNTDAGSRMVLVNGFDAWVETPRGRFSLTTQNYAPGVIGGDGAQRIERFIADPWPTWTFRLEDGTVILHEVLVAKDSPSVVVSWKLIHGDSSTRLFVRPLMSGRDYHSLHHENAAFNFTPSHRSGNLVWSPYVGIPEIVSYANGTYSHDPHWYRNFLYQEELARGLDCVEDLASPGVFQFELGSDEAIWLLSTSETSSEFEHHTHPALARTQNLRMHEEARRAGFESSVHRAGDAYIVKGPRGKTIIAGYPWFTDWGRDTFIALRGLCLATGRLREAADILSNWADTVSEGMLPNRFPDHGQKAEYNSVDASLWYVVAVGEFLNAVEAETTTNSDVEMLKAAVTQILEGYTSGTRFGIRQDHDGLLACGVPGVQLTWMDAKVGNWVVTPRIGKPVEVQALWANALAVGARIHRKWKRAMKRTMESFQTRFIDPDTGFLYDVIDVDHVSGVVDRTFRPNQILAVGGLPISMIEGETAKKIVDAVERELLTPLGLRSLAAFEPSYVSKYEGGVFQRDGAYHQGTVWPWLIGPFVEAWLRVRGLTSKAKLDAREKFLEPLLAAALKTSAGGHIPEIADSEPPQIARGCPFQAWSVAEALRVDALTRTPTTTPLRTNLT